LEKYFPGTRVSPRTVSLAGPSRAGNRKEDQQFVESATIDLNALQSSLKRQTEWRADLIPPLSGRAKFTGLYVIRGSPQSGEMSIEPTSQMKPQLRRSAMFFKTRFARHLHFAPTELTNSSQPTSYKHFVPTRLRTKPRLITISSEHFRVTYPSDVDHRDAGQVLVTLESARGDYLRRASSASIAVDIPLLDIRFNESTGDFTSRTGQPWWAAAATKGNRIELQPLPLLERRGVLWTTLRHELAHAVIDAVSHNRAPRWLAEGFAIYLAGEGRSFARYATKTKLTPSEIEKRLE